MKRESDQSPQRDTSPDGFLVPLQRLPVQVRPIRNETLSSYFPRVQRENYLRDAFLPTIRKRPDFRTALASLTGYSEHHLASALPELRKPSDLVNWPYLVGQVSSSARTRPACSICVVARLGRSPQVDVFASHDQLICPVHQRWIGSSELECREWQQFSIASCPDIARANHQHRVLIRQWGRKPVRASFSDAIGCFYKWSRWDNAMNAPDIQRRRGQLGVTEVIGMLSAKEIATWYPNAVTLTELLLSQRLKVARSRTKKLTARIDAQGITAFKAKVVEGFEPTGGTDPYRRAIGSAARSGDSFGHAA